MKFNMEALNHNDGGVRTVTERLIMKLYKDHGAPVKDFLPPGEGWPGFFNLKAGFPDFL